MTQPPPSPQYGRYQDPRRRPIGAPPGVDTRNPYGQKPPGPPDDGDFPWSLVTPRTVVALSVWILMFGLGAGLSGLVMFAVYQGQLNGLRSELLESQEELRRSLEEQVGSAPPAESTLNVSGSERGVDSSVLIETATPAILGISGREGSGRLSRGSGFVVNTTPDQTWVLTSYSLVAGVTDFAHVSVLKRTASLAAEVYVTDPGRDLALVIYRVPAERSLRFSRMESPEPGSKAWAVAGTRSRPYVESVEVTLKSVNSGLITFEPELDDDFVGGPLIDSDGRVMGVLTARAGSVTAVTPIDLACERVLRCPSSVSDSASGATGEGDEGAGEGDDDSDQGGEPSDAEE